MTYFEDRSFTILAWTNWTLWLLAVGLTYVATQSFAMSGVVGTGLLFVTGLLIGAESALKLSANKDLNIILGELRKSAR